MVEKSVIVKIPSGMHIRPAGILAFEVSNYQARGYIIFQHHTINVRSLLNLVAGGIRRGDEVLVRCEGMDEQEMLDTIISFLERETVEA